MRILVVRVKRAGAGSHLRRGRRVAEQRARDFTVGKRDGSLDGAAVIQLDDTFLPQRYEMARVAEECNSGRSDRRDDVVSPIAVQRILERRGPVGDPAGAVEIAVHVDWPGDA